MARTSGSPLAGQDRTKHRSGQLPTEHERLVAALFDGDWTDETAASAVLT
ncbi:hypothetical protein [Streptomyces sp. NRRL B-24720]|nr:hypothetical protein [Streptomyces sp. NRRL B-24720]